MLNYDSAIVTAVVSSVFLFKNHTFYSHGCSNILLCYFQLTFLYLDDPDEIFGLSRAVTDMWPLLIVMNAMLCHELPSHVLIEHHWLLPGENLLFFSLAAFIIASLSL